MKDLWRPINEIADRYAPNLLLCAPELVNLDCNPHGVGPGYWYNDATSNGAWLCAKWSMTNDEWYEKTCRPTHFLVIERPAEIGGEDEGQAVDPFTETTFW